MQKRPEKKTEFDNERTRKDQNLTMKAVHQHQ